MRFVILGCNLDALSKAHTTFDSTPSASITIYTEDAEAGFSENPLEPIILDNILDSLPSSWYGSIPKSVERKTPSSTSNSWLCKALAIRLAERGAQFLLHTKILGVDEEIQEISFRGGGSTPSGTYRYDQLYDFRQ